ncbi:Uncharacterised protein [uncultured archaeon]|nr:Uncharacterised protein [uncultured archaeon]
MKKKIIVRYKNKKIRIDAEDCGCFKKFSGLMFSKREKAEILLFDFDEKQKIRIHSFFVFYPFIAVWLDDKNRTVDLKIVNPFTPYASPKKSCFRLIEIPINRSTKKYQQFFIKKLHSSSVEI